MLTLTKNRYIALLTSLHIEFFNRTVAANNITCKNFLKKQATLREKWRKALQITEAETLRIYDLVDGAMPYLVQTGDNTLTVEPWPFEAKSFDISLNTGLSNNYNLPRLQTFVKPF